MRQALSRSLITVAAASGVLVVTGGYAHADTEARSTTSNSPGVLSGNSVQVPVDAPVNLCGNTVDPVALLNAAGGSDCGGGEEEWPPPAPPPVRHTPPMPPTQQTPPPVHRIPAPTHHDTAPPVHRGTPPVHHVAAPVQQVMRPMRQAAIRPVVPERAQLARTGSEDLGMAGAVSAGLLLSGAMLYRRTRAARV